MSEEISVYEVPKMVGRPPTGSDELDMLLYSAVGSGYALESIDASVKAGGVSEDVRNMINYEKVLDMTKARVTHALKRLKEKNLWSDSYLGLRSLCERRSMPVPFVALTLSTLAVNRDIHRTAISDEVWMSAIDLTMFLTERESFFDIQCRYGHLLERHLDTLYTLTCLIYRGKAVYDFAEQSVDEAESARDGLRFLQSVVMPTATEMAQDVERKDREIASLRQQIDNLKKQVSSLEKKEGVAQKDREVAKLRDEVLNLKAVIMDKDRELGQVREQSDMLLGMMESGVGGGLLDLPEYDVVFVGGHVNMVKKLRQVHPGWRFISGTNRAYPEFQRAAYVFAYCGHMAHSVYDRMRESLPDGVPMFYIDGVNLDRMEADMRAQYTEHISKISKNT